MKALRGLLRDLVERRLWPVAVVLLAAAIAVPVYLGRSSSADDQGAALPPVGRQADVGKASRAAVSIEEPATGDQRPGGVRNPFRQQHVPRPETPAESGSPAPAPSGAAPSTPTGSQVPSGGTGGPTSPPNDTTKPAPQPEADAQDVYHVTVRLGRTRKALRDLARLSPLPSGDNPVMVYAGVLKDGKTAVFLLASDTKTTGDGTCRPAAKSCESIEVKEGETESFDVTVNGQPVQYELDVLHVTTSKSSGDAARAGFERHSTAGAAMLRRAHVNRSARFKAAAAYRWVPEVGVLVRTPKDGETHAAALLPGLPVWHWKLGA